MLFWCMFGGVRGDGGELAVPKDAERPDVGVDGVESWDMRRIDYDFVSTTSGSREIGLQRFNVQRFVVRRKARMVEKNAQSFRSSEADFIVVIPTSVTHRCDPVSFSPRSTNTPYPRMVPLIFTTQIEQSHLDRLPILLYNHVALL